MNGQKFSILLSPMRSPAGLSEATCRVSPIMSVSNAAAMIDGMAAYIVAMKLKK